MLSRKQRMCLKNDEYDILDELYIQMNLAKESGLSHCVRIVLSCLLQKVTDDVGQRS